jgi:probable F420-dependent oxidoreductase
MTMQLGKLGVWASMDGLPAAEAALFAQRVEGWGYGALWLPESRGRNVLVTAGWLLAHTKTLGIATGIANIYARDGQASAAGQNALAELSAGRFLLGLGVSHVPLVEGVRGHKYGQPIATMQGYLEAMQRATYAAPPPPEKPQTVIAALGPKMLELAKTHCDGAHPYCVNPEHTKQARAILGPGKLLCPEQTVLLETDATKARRIARTWLSRYLSMDNYRNNLLRLGFASQELDGGGSDRVVDAIIAWGDEAAIRARVDAHWAAGADHVCIQALNPNEATPALPDERLLAALAPNARP